MIQWLLWRLFWLVRPKHLVGVFVVCLDQERQKVLLIRKKRGLSTGLQIPGGGKGYGVPPEQAAAKELLEETGYVPLTPDSLELVLVQSNEPHRDLHVVYRCRELENDLMPPQPRDTFEIAEAQWVSYNLAQDVLPPDHLKMFNAARRTS